MDGIVNPCEIGADLTINRKELLREFQWIEDDPGCNMFLHEARTLPKIYDMNYPVMVNRLGQRSYQYQCQWGFRTHNRNDWRSRGTYKRCEQQR